MLGLWAWMKSTDGQVAATWVSAILSLVAIALAAWVFVAEGRRARADLLREAEQERLAIERAETRRLDRQALQIAAAAELMERAQCLMRDLPSEGEMYVSWTTRMGKPRDLRSIKQSIEALRAIVTDDVDLLLDLSEAATILDATISPPGMSSAPTASFVRGNLIEQNAALTSVSSRMSARYTSVVA